MEQRRRVQKQPKRDVINGNDPSLRKSKALRRRKVPKRGSDKISSSTVILLASSFLGLFLLGYMYSVIGIFSGRNQTTSGGNALANGSGSNGSPLALRGNQPQKQTNKIKLIDDANHGPLQPAASLDDVASFLLKLVRMSSNDLRHIYEDEDRQDDSKAKDPFQLEALERGECPHVDSTIDWLPPKIPSDASTLFKIQQSSTDKDSSNRKVGVWFEHLSKAGGTSMCNLANANMPKKDVPQYYCMPSEPDMVDARVGQWTNRKLQNYIRDKKKYFVSNEWEPFPLDKFNMRPSVDGGNHDDSDPWLIFVTTLRHPLNRLVSAYKFWGILHNTAENKPTLAEFLQRRENRARNDMNDPQGLGKHLGANDDFLAMVGRPNFAMWKFSGGTMPLPKSIGGAVPWGDIEDEWVNSFLVAVKTLCQYDLVIPMELLSTTHETKDGSGVGPLYDILGWDSFEDSHVVNTGPILNSKAKESDLSEQEYDELWDKNRMDMVIYYWTRAVYLTRIHCASRLVA
uniref:Sulfotransferase domain-containing protein n=1 Tax=Helicotheca tamesis TaxID=374047 RepID=A0A7S2GX97_9STRA